MMYVALTYDHRIVDGREAPPTPRGTSLVPCPHKHFLTSRNLWQAVTFLKQVKELVEDPQRMLLDL